MLEKKRKKKRGVKAAASAMAAVTAAGVMVGGAFASPDDILTDGPDAIVQTVTMDAQVTAADDGGGADLGGDDLSEDEEGKRGVRASVRKLVYAAPVELRALVAVPLWALGTAVMALASSLWASVLSPTAAAVLGWLGMAVLAVLIFTLTAKTVFPDMPLKKILNKRSILTIVSLCLLFGVADAVLPFFWEDYQKLSKLLRVLGSLVCTGVPVAFFVRRHKRRTPEVIEAEPVEPEPPEPTQVEKEASARALVLELADSVCRKA